MTMYSEQQTAISEVLRAIASSPHDLQSYPKLRLEPLSTGATRPLRGRG